MTDPWFTTEVYTILPGLIVGLSGGAYGVLIGLMINNKNFKRIFPFMTVVALLVCLSSIIFGVIAMLYDQPEGTFYDFASTGLIGLIVISLIYRTINKIAFSSGGK
tara:strand:+ start:33690 stop:34007 length:318 start_codon:yes stop_codon:yes gene_type:complete